MSEYLTESLGSIKDRSDIVEVPNTALLNEIAELRLPNLLEAVRTQQAILNGTQEPHIPLSVRPPIPGAYTTRHGERLSSVELVKAVDEWLDQTEGHVRFIIQGGNRYVSTYAKETHGCTVPDVKVMSVEKSPLSVQLQTMLSADERRAEVTLVGLEGVASSMTRAELFQLVAGTTLSSPFGQNASDQYLQEELAETISQINLGIAIPEVKIIAEAMKGTAIADALSYDGPIHFLDDLFYRGRTLYSLAVLVTACGGNPRNIRLTTICSDVKSAELKSPFHKVLRSGVLYPFENSIRTEQGYWQDVGTHYIYTDMGAYWEHLHTTVDRAESQGKYTEWQHALNSWCNQYASQLQAEADTSLVNPLLWLSVYHRVHGLELNIDKIVDQKGYRIGACVPFTQLIDRFISQEETVEVRREFKRLVRDVLLVIEQAALEYPEGFRALMHMYDSNRRALDYQGLHFLAEQEE